MGEEAVVRQGRKVRVAGGEPWRGRCIANDYDLEALFQKMTQVGLHAEVKRSTFLENITSFRVANVGRGASRVSRRQWPARPGHPGDGDLGDPGASVRRHLPAAAMWSASELSDGGRSEG